MANDYQYIAVCPEPPVNNQCPVALVVVENPLPEPLTFSVFKAEVLPSAIYVLLIVTVWKYLKRQTWNR